MGAVYRHWVETDGGVAAVCTACGRCCDTGRHSGDRDPAPAASSCPHCGGTAVVCPEALPFGTVVHLAALTSPPALLQAMVVALAGVSEDATGREVARTVEDVGGESWEPVADLLRTCRGAALDARTTAVVQLLVWTRDRAV